MLTLIAAAAIVQAAPVAQPVTVIHAGTLIDVPGRAPKRNASVIIQGRKIIEVRNGFADVPGARVIDLRSSTVMPGLIDAHVHLGGLDDRIQARLQELVRNSEDEAYTALPTPRRRWPRASPPCATSAAIRPRSARSRTRSTAAPLSARASSWPRG